MDVFGGKDGVCEMGIGMGIRRAGYRRAGYRRAGTSSAMFVSNRVGVVGCVDVVMGCPMAHHTGETTQLDKK